MFTQLMNIGESPRGLVVKPLDCGIAVSEFEFQSCYYVDFRTNTVWKGMKPLSYGLNSTITVLLKGRIRYLMTQVSWCSIKQTNEYPTSPVYFRSFFK